RLRDRRDSVAIGNLEQFGLLDGTHQQNLPRCHPESALHLLMTGMADQDHGAALIGISLDFGVHLGDERARRVDNPQLTDASAIPFAGRNPVGAENHALAPRHVVKALDENRALPLQGLKHEAIVNYLMTDVERTPVSLERAPYRLNGPIDARAKAA